MPDARAVLIRVHAVLPGRASLRLGTPIPGSPRVWYVIAPVDRGEIAVRTTEGQADRVRELLLRHRQSEALHPRELRLRLALTAARGCPELRLATSAERGERDRLARLLAADGELCSGDVPYRAGVRAPTGRHADGDASSARTWTSTRPRTMQSTTFPQTTGGAGRPLAESGTAARLSRQRAVFA